MFFNEKLNKDGLFPVIRHRQAEPIGKYNSNECRKDRVNIYCSFGFTLGGSILTSNSAGVFELYSKQLSCTLTQVCRSGTQLID